MILILLLLLLSIFLTEALVADGGQLRLKESLNLLHNNRFRMGLNPKTRRYEATTQANRLRCHIIIGNKSKQNLECGNFRKTVVL